MKNLKYVITGTGRCGTKYMRDFFNACNIPCGHQNIFTEMGIIDYENSIKALKGNNVKFLIDNGLKKYKVWYEDIIAESSLYAAPYTVDIDCVVIHIVRHPLFVIRSFIGNYDKYFNELRASYGRFLPDIVLYEDKVECIAYYWVEWNKMIRSDFFHRIEDSDERLCEFLNVKKPIFSYYEIPTNGTDVTLYDIKNKSLRDSVYDLGVSYGYKFANKLYV